MKVDFLRRYTELPYLMHLLHSKKLTLVNPKTWDDRNDFYFLEIYKKEKNLKSLLALCFAERTETYHHWKVFSGNSSGVCIEFDKAKLLSSLSAAGGGIRSGKVEYRTINSLKTDPPKLEELPFVKRKPFADEEEFRLIYEDIGDIVEYKEFQIEIDTIIRVIVNPWMPRSVFDSVKKLLKKIDGCGSLTVNKTSLIDNESWKKIGDMIV